MKNVKKVLWVVMAMVLLTAGACADAGYPEFKDVEIAESEMLVGGEGEMCFDDGTCNEGLVCIEEICRIVFVKAECRDDGDCDEDLICEEGACVEDGPTDTPIAKGGLGDPCFDDGRCKVGLYCANDDMCHSMETVVVPPPRAGINSYDEPVGINRTWGVARFGQRARLNCSRGSS